MGGCPGGLCGGSLITSRHLVMIISIILTLITSRYVLFIMILVIILTLITGGKYIVIKMPSETDVTA